MTTTAPTTISRASAPTIVLTALALAAWFGFFYLWPMRQGVYTYWPEPMTVPLRELTLWPVPVLLTLATWIRFDRERHQ